MFIQSVTSKESTKQIDAREYMPLINIPFLYIPHPHDLSQTKKEFKNQTPPPSPTQTNISKKGLSQIQLNISING